MQSYSALHGIPGFDTFTTIKPIHKGWSGDEKYYVETVKNEKLLIRIADRSKVEKKKREFELMGRIAALGLFMSRPLDFGLCNDNQSVYTLLTWCEGEEATIVLPTLSAEEQYAYGLKAGQIQKAIHGIESFPPSPEWGERYNRKIDEHIETYLACGLTFDGDQKPLHYIEENRHLIDRRPTCIVHGDFHVGNLVISPEKESP